jgi:hypothetical protein
MVMQPNRAAPYDGRFVAGACTVRETTNDVGRRAYEVFNGRGRSLGRFGAYETATRYVASVGGRVTQ